MSFTPTGTPKRKVKPKYESPARGFTYGSPPRGFIHGSPARGFTYGSPARGFTHGSPPRGFTHGSPARGFTHGSPPRGFTHGSPPRGFTHGSPPRGFTHGTPQNDMIDNQDINILNDIVGIRCISYKSHFGFIFLITYANGEEKLLKAYILDQNAWYNTESQYFELPNYINVELAQKPIEPTKPSVFGFADDNDYDVGESKRIESLVNFDKEADIQKNVYETSKKNGPLCPEIYNHFSLVSGQAIDLLNQLNQKHKDEESGNMIQYLIKNIKYHHLGIIVMEYAKDYQTFDKSRQSQSLYENAIYTNLRLLLETGYLHLDLNYGNVMVRGENDIYLIDFGKSKKLVDLVKSDKDTKCFNIIKKIAIKNEYEVEDISSKNEYEVEDISSLIECINHFDRNYGVDNWGDNLFKQNFINKLTDIEQSYQNIAIKLNSIINNSNAIPMINTNYKIPTHGSPTRASSNILKSNSSMFDPDDDDANDNENMNPNLMYTPQKSGGISTPPKFTVPKGLRGGTKRKHKNKSKKTRKNKSNKKRVKLISKK